MNTKELENCVGCLGYPAISTLKQSKALKINELRSKILRAIDKPHRQNQNHSVINFSYGR